MAGGDGSCVGGWIPTDSTDAQRSVHNGFGMPEMEKQFGTIFTPGQKFYAYYKCNGVVPCNGTNGFDGLYSPIPNKPSPYAAGNPIGFSYWMNHRVGRIIRKPHQLTPTNIAADVSQNGLYLDLTGWKTSNTVQVKFSRWENNSGHFLDIRLFGPQNQSGTSTPFTGGYTIRGDSDTNRNYGGTNWATFSENMNPTTFNMKGGLYYMIRTHDHSRGSSGIYCGGEDQGGGAGTASYTVQHLSVHDNGACCGDNNTYGRCDFGAKIEIVGWS